MAAKKPSLALAMKGANTKQEVKKEEPLKLTSADRPPSRQGKKAISAFFDPNVSKQLKRLALDEDSTVQKLMAEALNDLFIKHNQKPIA